MQDTTVAVVGVNSTCSDRMAALIDEGELISDVDPTFGDSDDVMDTRSLFKWQSCYPKVRCLFLLKLGRMTALRKDTGGVRGIVSGSYQEVDSQDDCPTDWPGSEGIHSAILTRALDTGGLRMHRTRFAGSV